MIDRKFRVQSRCRVELVVDKPQPNKFSIIEILSQRGREREREEMPLQRLECEVQNYAWGKIGSESKVARFKHVEGTKIDEVRNFFFS